MKRKLKTKDERKEETKPWKCGNCCCCCCWCCCWCCYSRFLMPRPLPLVLTVTSGFTSGPPTHTSGAGGVNQEKNTTLKIRMEVEENEIENVSGRGPDIRIVVICFRLCFLPLIAATSDRFTFSVNYQWNFRSLFCLFVGWLVCSFVCLLVHLAEEKKKSSGSGLTSALEFQWIMMYRFVSPSPPFLAFIHLFRQKQLE